MFYALPFLKFVFLEMASKSVADSVVKDLNIDNKVETVSLLHTSLQTIADYYNVTVDQLHTIATSTGSWRLLDLDDFKSFFDDGGLGDGEYNGVGCSLFAFDVKAFSPIGYTPTIGEIKARGDKYYDLPSKLTAAQGNIAKVHMKHMCTLCVPVTGPTTPGERGQWRRLNGDVDTCAMIDKFAQLIDSLKNPKTDEETRKVLSDVLIPRMLRFVTHVPVDFKRFSADPSDSRDVFAHSFQITENVKIRSDRYRLLLVSSDR